MAKPPLDLDDFNSLMAMGVMGHNPWLELYNLGRTKAGKSTASGPSDVILSPTSYDDRVDTQQQVIARVKAALQASA
ncbi:hypothetical protein ACWCRF_07255 [Streptomyces sp. NPDC002405]